jgi:alpha-glucosidase/alpha-D-xyloside xylohydrolase
MSRGSGWFLWLFGLAIASQSLLAQTSSSGLRFAGQSVELVISEVSPQTVRIELLPSDEQGSARQATPSSVLVPLAAKERLRLRELPIARTLEVGRLRVTVKPRPLAVSLSAATDPNSHVQDLVFDDGPVPAVEFQTRAPVLGLGEGAKQFDRRGALYPMEPSWGGWNRAVLGSVVPSPYLIGTEGWALFAHQPQGQFDLRKDRGRFVPDKEGLARVGLDLFIVDVQSPSDAVAEYVRLTGQPVMPPKWALGYFQSHRTLAGPAEPLAIAKTFRDRGLPCDALIYLGTGYCPNGWNTGHGSLTFNPKAFEHPAEDIRALHDLNFRVILHVNHAPQALFGDSIAEASDSPLHIRNYWARHKEVFGLGVDGWWPDDGDELPLESRLTRHRCYYEGPLQDRPNVRPWSLHRTGYAGSQRYGGWIWSGDIDGTWATLAAQVSVGLNHSLSLTPFWGTDTGGFYPTPELTGELYVRWFQFSAFCPLFRSHGRTWQLRLPWGWSTGQTGPVEHPQGPDPAELHNPNVEPICRKYLELRYRLLAYNYSLIREACDTGMPPMRALWMHYPADSEAVRLGSEYLWGRDILVAPVVEKGAKVRRLYLPSGIWYDWWTGEKVQGGRWMERPVDLATLPLYVRAGSVIPLDPLRQYTGQAVTDPTTLRVYPGTHGILTLYDDDGQGLGYSDGSDPKTVWIRVQCDDGARRLNLAPDPRMKRWPGGVRAFLVEAVGRGTQPTRVEFHGEPLEVGL